MLRNGRVSQRKQIEVSFFFMGSLQNLDMCGNQLGSKLQQAATVQLCNKLPGPPEKKKVNEKIRKANFCGKFGDLLSTIS